jgi:hypothetical protein
MEKKFWELMGKESAWVQFSGLVEGSQAIAEQYLTV